MTATATMIDAPAGLWSEAERAAWAPPRRLKPSEWAERERFLPRDQSARPGPWRNAAAPYLATIMDLCVAAGVERLDIEKPSQVGVSEALRNVIGYWAENDPDPCGLTLPSREKGREIVENRIIPMLRETPALRRYISPRSHDTKKSQIRLVNGFLLHLMWSGSPSAMASDPMRRTVNDETDKYDAWTKGDAGAVALTWRRLESYGSRKLQVNVSTPTTRYGQIHTLLESDDPQLYYYVPCPHCGTRQRLVVPQLRWKKYDAEDRFERARRVVRNRTAWYECAECGAKLRERDKREMVAAGRWTTEAGTCLDADGRRHADAADVAAWPPGTRIGMQISALCCLWRSWPTIAAEAIEAEGDRRRMFDFRTNTLGEPFEQQVARAHHSVFAAKSQRAELDEGIVPRWAWKLLTSIDTQHDYFYCVQRAWGHNLRSQRVWHGRVETFAELDALLTTPRPVEGDAGPAMISDLALIDTGGTRVGEEEASRTMQVYRWALGRRARVRPIKGASKRKGELRIWHGEGFLKANPESKGRGRKVRIWFLDTEHFQDELADLIAAGTAEPADPDGAGDAERQEEIWHLNRRDDDEYNRHLSAMHKVTMPSGRDLIERWIPVQSGSRHDYRDCEVYQVAAAYLAQVHLLPDEEELARQRAVLAREQRERKRIDPQQRRSEAWNPKRIEI